MCWRLNLATLPFNEERQQRRLPVRQSALGGPAGRQAGRKHSSMKSLTQQSCSQSDLRLPPQMNKFIVATSGESTE